MELENIYMLSVGQLRELLAYACADEGVDSWWEDITEEDLERVGFYDEEDDYDYDDEDTSYDEEDCYDEEEEDDLDLDEDDEVCKIGSEPLTDSEAESLAVTIAEEIYLGKYDFSVIEGLYSDEMLDRINYLAN